MMLNVVCYDIFEPRNHANFKRGVNACGGDNHNFAYAPWMVDTSQPPTRILRNLQRNLHRKSDNLMVLNLGSRASCAMVNPKASDRKWLRDHRVDFRGRNRSGVVGIAYTLHGAGRGDYDRLQRKITGSFPDHFKPVKALYFVATDKSARAVRDTVKQFLPNRQRRRPDELMVLEIPARTTGTTQLWSRDGEWFREHGIDRVH